MTGILMALHRFMLPIPIARLYWLPPSDRHSYYSRYRGLISVISHRWFIMNTDITIFLYSPSKRILNASTNSLRGILLFRFLKFVPLFYLQDKLKMISIWTEELNLNSKVNIKQLWLERVTSFLADKLMTDEHIETQTQTMTILEGQNWPPEKWVKLFYTFCYFQTWFYFICGGNVWSISHAVSSYANFLRIIEQHCPWT